ncbi:MAG: hypothetical protein ACKPKO_34655, partial [Candidatus Fonsibacter sp.]
MGIVANTCLSESSSLSKFQLNTSTPADLQILGVGDTISMKTNNAQASARVSIELLAQLLLHVPKF